MKKYQKILLVTSACLVVGGGVMAVAGMALGGTPAFMITNEGIKTPEDVMEGEFVEKTLPLKGIRSMEIQWEEGNIEIVEGDDFHVEYGYDEKYIQVKEQTKNGTWHLTGKYVQRIGITGIHFFWQSAVWEQEDSYLKIYIPKGTKLSNLNLISGYAKVKIDLMGATAEQVNLEAGNLDMKGLSAESADLNLEYGNLNLESCSFTNLTVNNESGKCSFADIHAEQAEVTLDYEDIGMQDCDIAKLTVTNESGACRLENITAEEMTVTSDYGALALDQVTADTVTLKNESGNISVNGLTGKTLDAGSEYGIITLNAVTMDTSIRAEGESESIQMNQVKTGQLDIVNESGNVEGNQVEISKGSLELGYGDCDIAAFTVKDVKLENESGEVNLELTGKAEDYSMILKTEYGEVTINGEKRGSDIILERDKAEGSVEIASESSNIEIKTQ